MKIDARYVWFLFASAAGCVVVKSVLVTWMLASAASRTGTVGNFYYTSGRYCRELEALVTLLCTSAFITWTYLIWTRPDSKHNRVLNTFVALIVSSLVFVGVAIALSGEVGFS
jgi:hypothetical protein